MLADEPRTLAYKTAIERNAKFLRGKVDMICSFYQSGYQCLKDRVGRSGCHLLWVHLNRNISLDFQGIKTYDMSKNSPFPYLFTDIRQAAKLALARGQMPVKCWSGQ